MSNTSTRVFSVGVEVSTTDAGAVIIACHPESVPIEQGKSDVLIRFALTGASGFSFSPSNAIVPDDKSKADFPHESWTINNTLAALYDRNNNKATVKYTVNVVDSQGNPYSYDPDIQNGGSAGTC
jgi:hypothetical protein